VRACVLVCVMCAGTAELHGGGNALVIQSNKNPAQHNLSCININMSAAYHLSSFSSQYADLVLYRRKVLPPIRYLKRKRVRFTGTFYIHRGKHEAMLSLTQSLLYSNRITELYVL
jgi:hypothetical protein